jgi:hypothetical protein
MYDAQYVDFDAIRAVVTFDMVFAHYGIAVVRRSGSELRIHCPFHEDGNLGSVPDL